MNLFPNNKELLHGSAAQSIHETSRGRVRPPSDLPRRNISPRNEAVVSTAPPVRINLEISNADALVQGSCPGYRSTSSGQRQYRARGPSLASSAHGGYFFPLGYRSLQTLTVGIRILMK
jgi:hypothetical protein